MQVLVYRNLHNGKLSIKDPKTSLVLGHAMSVDLYNVTFIVNEAGRQRVLRDKKKNVHAYVRGDIGDVDGFKSFKDRNLYVSPKYHPYLHQPQNTYCCTVRYNPYQHAHFVDSKTDMPVKRLDKCSVSASGYIIGYT